MSCPCESQHHSTFNCILAGGERPRDYISSGINPFTFAPSVNRTQCQSMEIVADRTYEGDETFRVSLSSSGSNGVFFHPRVMTVTIQDIDCKHRLLIVEMVSSMFVIF
jgi:hypothetical protein